MVLYPHLSQDAVLSMEGYGDPVLTRETLIDWLEVPDHVQLTMRPVIDLTANIATGGRFASGLQREQGHPARQDLCRAVLLTTRRTPRPGPRHPVGTTQRHRTTSVSTGSTTKTHNLAALCRHHHRAKTHTAWDYQQLLPGVFLWESPHGLRYLTTSGRTIDLQ